MEVNRSDELIHNGYYVAVIDGAKCENLSSFLTNIAEAFKFPKYFGNNINSFLECINDLDWLLESNYALIVNNSNLFMSNDTNDTKIYVNELLEKIADEWSSVPNFKGEEEFRKKADFQLIYC